MTPLGWLGRKTSTQSNIWSGSTLFAKAYLSQYLGLVGWIFFSYFCMKTSCWGSAKVYPQYFVFMEREEWYLSECFLYLELTAPLLLNQIAYKAVCLYCVSCFIFWAQAALMAQSDACLTSDQEVVDPATFFHRLIKKYFLWSFAPFGWFKKGSCQFLAKESAQYWLTA